MTTPSGTISVSDVNTELSYSSTRNSSLGETVFRQLAGVPSGAVSMSNLQNKINLRWGDTGSTYHPDIAVYGGTYGGGYANWDIYSYGLCQLNVPTDAGGDSFSDGFLAAPASSGNYRVRLYNSSPYAISDPNNNPVYPGNWSGYFSTSSNLTFGLYYASYSGTLEFTNTSNSQGMSINFTGYVSVYS